MSRTLAVRSLVEAVAVWSCVLASVVESRAEEPPVLAAIDAPTRWTLSAEPGLWYAAPGGTIRLPTNGGAAADLKLGDLNLDSPRLSPFAEVNLTRDRWGVSVRAFSFGTSDRTSAPPVSLRIGDVVTSPNEPLRASLDLASLELEGRYRFFRNQIQPMERGGYRVGVWAEAVAGVRIFETDLRVERVNPIGGSPSTAGGDEYFVQPLIGLKTGLIISERITLDVCNTFGLMPGGRESFMWDIIAGVQWHVFEHVSVQIGYRQLLYRTMTDDGPERFENNGAIAGINVGVVIRF